MQNSIKVTNELFETTFSGGVSTTIDKRLGAEGDNSGSGNGGYIYVATSGSGLTNKQVFDLVNKGVVLVKSSVYISYAYKSHGEINFRFASSEPVVQETTAEDQEFSIYIGEHE